jgi:hypothetical protein
VSEEVLKMIHGRLAKKYANAKHKIPFNASEC